ncbi:DUF2096 domain-containing protein [Candidatus Bathyarchaeota archaeon]|nr:MAG: DUF2096 domain-containing protein [Candidatus Bathyarchaeota archaeon]
MGHNMATWKLLEEMLIELKKKGVSIPSDIMEDLRAAKSMITLSCMQGGGDAIQKTEEYTANVEAYLINEAQKLFNSETADQWLRRLEDANAEVCDEAKAENTFVTGVPRDKKWVRVEPIKTLPTDRILQMAKEQKLQVKLQNDDRLLVYGQNEDIKIFLKKMAAEAAVKK